MSRSFPQRSKGRYHLSIRLLLCLRRCKIARGMALCTAFPTLPLIPASNFVVRSRDSPSKDSFLTKPIYERHPICFSKVHSHEFILRCDDRLSVHRSRRIFFDFRDGFSYYFLMIILPRWGNHWTSRSESSIRFKHQAGFPRPTNTPSDTMTLHNSNPLPGSYPHDRSPERSSIPEAPAASSSSRAYRRRTAALRSRPTPCDNCSSVRRWGGSASSTRGSYTTR